MSDNFIYTADDNSVEVEADFKSQAIIIRDAFGGVVRIPAKSKDIIILGVVKATNKMGMWHE